MATYHPSALLRMPDEDARERAYDEFLSDLKKVAKHLATL
jgi:uracil-DNA glycosylase